MRFVLLPILLPALLPVLLWTVPAPAQWQMQQSHTTASLRGIAAVPAATWAATIAWASGTGGTVLRTTDGGDHWTTCAIPPGAATLDFRGIQAWDAKTAIVMSSGPGDQSRLYKTTDGCRSWKLLFTNPDKAGFWDTVNAADQKNILILGDPVNGQFVIRKSDDSGQTWSMQPAAPSRADEGAFAASNSSLLMNWIHGPALFGTGSPQGARVFVQQDASASPAPLWTSLDLPMFASGKGAGIFSLGHRGPRRLVAVGGDYTQPNATIGTAAYSSNGGKAWLASTTPPTGYRSSVAYDEAAKAFIAVGPNGTDISFDDGKTFRPLKPGKEDAPGSDRDWNALSLPFVVGPKGRIGKLEPAALSSK